MSISDVVKNKNKGIFVICPVCKSKKEIKLPLGIIEESRQLTTVSIPSGTTCPHHYQVFIDKSLKIRGYQRVDFEIKTKQAIRSSRSLKEIYEDFWDLIEDNNIEFRPYILADKRRRKGSSKKKLIIKEILIENIHKSPTLVRK